ncbi:MAG: pyridoxal phosphate-dependent aminotransferase [Chloroflexi bacterium]|nr:pyridoxal phosphate-dependent aminotransferase [Chloroflexota bacterium]
MSDHILDQITLGALVIVRDKMMAQQAAGRKVYRLEVGDTSFDTPAHIRKAIVDALESGKTHYPPSTGLPALREAMLNKMREQNRLPIKDADHVMVTIGGMHALYMAFSALLEPGDEVILPDPMWSEIAELIRRPGGVPVHVKLHPERDFLYDPADIEAAVTPRTRAIYVNTPHNPVGTVLSEETLRAIADIANRHGLTVVSDEAYENVIFDGRKHVSIGSLAGMGDRTVTCFTLSKTYAMTGLRLGYLASNDPVLLDRVRKLLRLTTNGVPSITQWGGLAALTGPQAPTQQMMAELEKRRDIFYKGLETIKVFDSFKPQGAFYVWAKISKSWGGYDGAKDSWAMTNYLIDQAGIGTSPGIAFGESGGEYVRFAFTVEPNVLVESIEVMQDLFN